MTKIYQAEHDNIETKKEIWNILNSYMDDRSRQQFMEYCCKIANQDINRMLRPRKHHTWTAYEVYWGLWSLIYMHQLELNAVIPELQRIARLK
jgi:hypothetical protein